MAPHIRLHSAPKGWVGPEFFVPLNVMFTLHWQNYTSLQSQFLMHQFQFERLYKRRPTLLQNLFNYAKIISMRLFILFEYGSHLLWNFVGKSTIELPFPQNWCQLIFVYIRGIFFNLSEESPKVIRPMRVTKVGMASLQLWDNHNWLKYLIKPIGSKISRLDLLLFEVHMDQLAMESMVSRGLDNSGLYNKSAGENVLAITLRRQVECASPRFLVCHQVTSPGP